MQIASTSSRSRPASATAAASSALGGGVRRIELRAMAHEGGLERIGDRDLEVGVSGIHSDHDAEIGGEREAPSRPPRAVGADGSCVRQLTQDSRADQGVDGVDRGRPGQRRARHDLGGGELSSGPGEVEHGSDARAPGAEICGNFCHGS